MHMGTQQLERPAHLLEEVLMDEALTPREVEVAAGILHRLHRGPTRENFGIAHDELLGLLGNIDGTTAAYSVRQSLESIDDILASK